tara:strand:- start:1010 stop:1192 length:183 start_codon:yes stop_codon:yes gene_type:complete
MPAPKGNQNAAKDGGKTSVLLIRCTPADKSRWVRTANKRPGRNLTDWVTDTLNKHADAND